MADGVSPLSLDAASNTRITRVTVNWNLYAGHRYPRSIFISVTPSSPALMIHRLPLSFPFPGNWTREGHSGLLGYRVFFHFWIWWSFFGKFWIGGFSEDLKTGIWNWLYTFMSNDSSFWLVGFGNKGNNALVVRNWTSNFRKRWNFQENLPTLSPPLNIYTPDLIPLLGYAPLPSGRLAANETGMLE